MIKELQKIYFNISATIKSIRWVSKLISTMALFAAPLELCAQDAGFFRVVGPKATAITAFRPDGTLVWSNEPVNGTFTVQKAVTLAGANHWVDFVQIPATNNITSSQVMDLKLPAGMALIPAGSFTMGDTAGEGYYESPLHTVYVSGFYMDCYDVTKSLWDSVYNWATNHGYDFDNPGLGKAANHPVQTISWYDCIKWCNARSEKAGKTPAYYTGPSQLNIYRTGQSNVEISWVKWNTGYRLPTEAEWEKAARSGTSANRFPWGNTISWSRANYFANSLYCSYDVNAIAGYCTAFNDGIDPYTSPVGYFPANGYGLYDMSGNVRQWSWDAFGDYTSDSQSDPRGTENVKFGPGVHPIRGGCCYNAAPACRVSNRVGTSANYTSSTTGFRSVLSPGL